MVDPVSAKNHFAEMLRILREDSFYMPKILDAFYQLPSIHQDCLIGFLDGHINKTDWKEWVEDRDFYPDFMKGVLLHYSGRDEFDEPTKEDLSRVLGEYCRSESFKLAERKLSGEKTLAEMVQEDLA